MQDLTYCGARTYCGGIGYIVDHGRYQREQLPELLSEMAPHRVKNPADEVSEGQEIMVKCIAVDANGKIKLSRKALMAAEAPAEQL